MLKVESVNNQVPTAKNTNFRAASYVQPQEIEYDSFVKAQQDAQKKAKKQQNINTGVQVAVLGVLGASLAIMAKQAGLFKRFKLQYKDLAKELSLDEMALPESQKKAAERIKNRIENYTEIRKKGGKKGTAILFYGPPGTGKNTFSYAIAKKFPNSKFVEMDISKMNSKWHGESEQNVLGTMNAVIKAAKKNTKEKYFVFIDEIDSVMMQDKSSSAKLSQDILNAFKKGFNSLTNQENVIVMGATNLRLDPAKAMAEGKMLDSAMVDRFAQKVLVDLPTKSQIKESIKKFYQNSDRGMVDDALKNIDDKRWDKIAEFLANKDRQTSFRKLNDILGTAAEESKTGKNVGFDDVINAIKTNQNSLYASDVEMQKFLNSLK